MEENHKKECQNGCMCGVCGGHGKMCCGWGGMHRFVVLRIVIGLVVLGFVFAAGVKIGEFKASFGSLEMSGRHQKYYGSQMMPSRNYFPSYDSYGPGMMNQRGFQQPDTVPQQ